MCAACGRGIRSCSILATRLFLPRVPSPILALFPPALWLGLFPSTLGSMASRVNRRDSPQASKLILVLPAESVSESIANSPSEWAAPAASAALQPRDCGRAWAALGLRRVRRCVPSSSPVSPARSAGNSRPEWRQACGARSSPLRRGLVQCGKLNTGWACGRLRAAGRAARRRLRRPCAAGAGPQMRRMERRTWARNLGDRSRPRLGDVPTAAVTVWRSG